MIRSDGISRNGEERARDVWGLLVGVVLLLGRPAQAQESWPDIDQDIEATLAEWSIPGAAVAVVEDRKITFLKGYGVLELGRPEKVDRDSLFGIGSISKVFTTAALARLVEQGRLRWDDKIIDHLPGFRLADPWITANVTIRDVLTHRVGSDSKAWNMGISRKQSLATLRETPLQGTFRDTFLYSNATLSMLGELIEAVTGQTWEEFVTREVLEPLQMTRSLSGRDRIVPAANLATAFWGHAPTGAVLGQAGLMPGVTNVAVPHGWDSGDKRIVYPWHHEQANAPAGGVTTSAHDMALFMLAQLSGSTFLRHGTLAEIFKLQSVQKRGLGWSLRDYKGNQVAEHGGGQIGYEARTLLVPSKGIGVTVLLNRHYRDERLLVSELACEGVALQLLDRALGLAFSDWRTRAHAAERAARQEAKRRMTQLRQWQPSTPLSDYAGTYINPAVGTVEIKVEGKVLTFHFSPYFSGKLIYEGGGERFALRFDAEHMPAGLRRETVTFSWDLGQASTPRPHSFTFWDLRFERQ